jgi:hypothetical protein
MSNKFEFSGLAKLKHIDDLLDLEEKTLKRLKSKFMKNVYKTSTCWEWLGATYNDGRARTPIQISSCRTVARIIHVLFVGPVKELHVLHTCDNVLCVRASHLFLGTHTDNMQDRARKGRRPHTKGVANPNVKLTEKDVLQILKLHKKGYDNKKLSELFNISNSNIWQITTGKTWTHLQNKS